MFTGAYGKQYELVLIITSRTKLEILGHVVHFVCVCSSRDKTVWRLSTKKGFKSRVNALSLNCRNLKER